MYQAIIETGEDLIQQKEALGHGNFLPWVRGEFGMSEDTAQKFMRIARELGSNAESSRYLSFEALAKLAAPSTPEPVRLHLGSTLGNKLVVAGIAHGD